MWNPFSWTQNSLKLMWSVQILLKKAQRNISRFSERISLVGEHNPFQTFIHTLFIPQNIEAQEKGHPVKKNQIFLKQRSNENNRPNEVHNGAFQCNTPHYVKNMQFWILASKTWRRFSLFGITKPPPQNCSPPVVSLGDRKRDQPPSICSHGPCIALQRCKSHLNSQKSPFLVYLKFASAQTHFWNWVRWKEEQSKFPLCLCTKSGSQRSVQPLCRLCDPHCGNS